MSFRKSTKKRLSLPVLRLSSLIFDGGCHYTYIAPSLLIAGVAETKREVPLKAPLKRAMAGEEALGNGGGVIKVISHAWLEEVGVLNRPERDGLRDDESVVLKLVLHIHRIGRKREIRQEAVKRSLVPGLLRVKVVKRLKRIVHGPRIV